MLSKRIPRILIITGSFLENSRSGGPNESIRGLIYYLRGRAEIYVFTTDRDIGDDHPRPNIFINEWQKNDGYNVYHADPRVYSGSAVKEISQFGQFDVIYFNSFFSPITVYGLLGLFRARVRNMPRIILAPRGEFSIGALAIKSRKKYTYINIFRILGLHNKIEWHASTPHERGDIERQFGSQTKIATAINLKVPIDIPKRKYSDQPVKKFVSLSRISPKKNLLFAISSLIEAASKSDYRVTLDIYGPIEDNDYWNRCLKAISSAPSNLNIEYKGFAAQGQSCAIFSQYDFFIFPTLGENYGHVIVESLLGGCPVLISDQTPWEGIEERGVGWISTLDMGSFVRIVEEAMKISQLEHRRMCNNASRFGKEILFDQDAVESNLKFFLRETNEST